MRRFMILAVTIVCFTPASALVAQCVPRGETGLAATTIPRWFLPIEVGLGGIARPAGARDLFTWSARVHPTVGIGADKRFRIAATAGLQLQETAVVGILGGRISYMVLLMDLFGRQGLGVSLAAEGIATHGGSLGGAVIADANGLLQATLRVSRHLGEDLTYFELALGTDLADRLFGADRGIPRPEPPDPVTPDYFLEVTYEVSIEADWLCDTDNKTERSQVVTLAPQLRAQDTPAGLYDLLKTDGLGDLAEAVEQRVEEIYDEFEERDDLTPPDPGAATDRRTVLAIVEGIRIALEEE